MRSSIPALSSTAEFKGHREANPEGRAVLTFFVFFVVIGRLLRTTFLFIRPFAENLSLDGLVSVFILEVIGVELEDV